MSTTTTTTTMTTTTTRDRGDRYGPMEWAQLVFRDLLILVLGCIYHCVGSGMIRSLQTVAVDNWSQTRRFPGPDLRGGWQGARAPGLPPTAGPPPNSSYFVFVCDMCVSCIFNL